MLLLTYDDPKDHKLGFSSEQYGETTKHVGNPTECEKQANWQMDANGTEAIQVVGTDPNKSGHIFFWNLSCNQPQANQGSHLVLGLPASTSHCLINVPWFLRATTLCHTP